MDYTVKQSAVVTLSETMEARHVCSLINRFAFLVQRADDAIIHHADQHSWPNLKVKIYLYTP